jgi:hypothetical protein
MSKWSSIGLYSNPAARTGGSQSSTSVASNGKTTTSEEAWYVFLALARILPGRLTAAQTAWILGFQPHHVSILVRAGLLLPLGNALPLRERWFATVNVLQLAQDVEFLAAATNAIYEHTEKDNAGRKTK